MYGYGGSTKEGIGGVYNLATADIRRSKKTKTNPYGVPGSSSLARRRYYERIGRIPKGAAARRGARAAMKAQLARLAGLLPSATKAVNDYAVDQWAESMENGVGGFDEGVQALTDLIQAGVPLESYDEVAAAIGELQAGLEEDEAFDEAGGYAEEDAYADAEEGGYAEEGEYEDAGGYGGEEVYDAEYAYAGDDGMGEFKAISPGDEFEDAAQALAVRTMDILAAQPAIKSVGYEAPYFHTHAPWGDHQAHVKAFYEYIRLGERHMQPMLLDHLVACTKAVMVEDSDSEGGHLVPDEFSKELIRALYNDSYLRKAGARLFRMQHKTLEIPAISESTRAQRTVEGGPYNEQEPTTTAITFYATKLTRIAKATEELVADSRFDVWSQILQPDFVQAFAEGENEDFTTGAGGTTTPQGVITAAGLGVTAAGTADITADEVAALMASLDYKYRGLASTAFMANDATFQYIRRLKDGQGRYIWGGDLKEGQPETLLGKRVIINNSMATLATGAKVLLFGAFQYFGIADRTDMQIRRLDEKYADEGKVGFRATKRNDSRMLLASAFKYLLTA
jgi:HK97 family phage major capsid protein